MSVVSSGTYTIGTNAMLKVTDSVWVEGITFAAGSTISMTT